MKSGKINILQKICRACDIILFIFMLFCEILSIAQSISESQAGMGIVMGIVFAITLISGFLQWRFITTKFPEK